MRLGRALLLAGAMLAASSSLSSAQDEAAVRPVANAIDGVLSDIRSATPQYAFEGNERYGRLALDYQGADFSRGCPRRGVLATLVSMVVERVRSAGLDMKVEIIGQNGAPDRLIFARTIFKVERTTFGRRCTGSADTLGGTTSMFPLTGAEQQIRVSFNPWVDDRITQQASATLAAIPGSSMPGIAAAADPYLRAINTVILARFEEHRNVAVSRTLRFNSAPRAYGLEFRMTERSGSADQSVLRLEMETTRSYFIDVGNEPITNYPQAATVFARAIRPNDAGTGMVSLEAHMRALPLFRTWLDAELPTSASYNDACIAIVGGVGALGLTETDATLVLARLGQMHSRLGNVQAFHSAGGCTQQFYTAADTVRPQIGPASWRESPRQNVVVQTGTVANVPAANAPADFVTYSRTSLLTVGSRFGRVARLSESQERLESANEIFAQSVRFYDPGRVAFGSIDQTRNSYDEFAELVGGGIAKVGCFLTYAPNTTTWDRPWAPANDQNARPAAIELVALTENGEVPFWIRLEFDSRITDRDAGPRITTVIVSKYFAPLAKERMEAAFSDGGCSGWPLPPLPVRPATASP